MLSELGVPQLRFVLFSRHSISVHLLTDLYPHPPLYRRVPGSRVVPHAAQFAGTCQPIAAAPWATAPAPLPDLLASGAVQAAYDKALKVATTGDRKDVVHPLRYAAGAWALRHHCVF